MWHLLKLAILVIAILFVLSFFGISIQGIIESPAGQANIGFVWGYILIAWQWIIEFSLDLLDVIIFWN
ncbi:hypothetical protein COB87_002770 [Candidatus Wolfebacteria bacterium]|nr:hypothetical protein [Candidatus Wolfebacteria bacterium]